MWHVNYVRSWSMLCIPYCEGISKRRQQCSLHPEEPVLMPAEVVWTPPLFCRPCRDSREESKHRVGEASLQSPDQADRWRLCKTRRGTQLCVSLPLLKSHSTPRRRQTIRKEWVWPVSAKITLLSIAQKQHSGRFQGPVWTVDTLLVINTVQNVPHFYLCIKILETKVDIWTRICVVPITISDVMKVHKSVFPPTQSTRA